MKEELNALKTSLEESKQYNIEEIFVLYDHKEKKNKIILPKKLPKIYQTLTNEQVKIIIKKDMVFINPNKYLPVLKNLHDFLNEPQKFYTVYELKEIEKHLHYDSALKR